jgi:hypothetical protein
MEFASGLANARIDRVRAENVTMSERVDRALRSNALFVAHPDLPGVNLSYCSVRKRQSKGIRPIWIKHRNSWFANILWQSSLTGSSNVLG